LPLFIEFLLSIFVGSTEIVTILQVSLTNKVGYYTFSTPIRCMIQLI
jgi:hypothetical protein